MREIPGSLQSARSLGLLVGVLLCLAACAPRSEVIEEPHASSVLVDADWLKAHLDDSSIAIIDLSFNESNYLEAHIPGALFVDWQTELSDPQRPELYAIMAQADFQSLMTKLGIQNDATVVLYDDMHSRAALRLFWIMRYYGHADIRLLDGGRRAWRRAGFVLESHAESEVVDHRPETDPGSTYTVSGTNDAIKVAFETVENASSVGQPALVDARPWVQFIGDANAAAFHNGITHLHQGHICGARNVPWRENFSIDGTFKSKSELQDLYRGKLDRQGDAIITYCNEGLHAIVPWFVLSELLGYEHVAVYDDSLADWANRDDGKLYIGEICENPVVATGA